MQLKKSLNKQKLSLNKVYTYYYFLGVGGIGMSALARFFNAMGKKVYGYDKTASPLTDQLSAEGIQISFPGCVSNLFPDAY